MPIFCVYLQSMPPGSTILRDIKANDADIDNSYITYELDPTDAYFVSILSFLSVLSVF